MHAGPSETNAQKVQICPYFSGHFSTAALISALSKKLAGADGLADAHRLLIDDAPRRRCSGAQPSLLPMVPSGSPTSKAAGVDEHVGDTRPAVCPAPDAWRR